MSNMFNNVKLKKRLTLFSLIVCLVVYFIVTDPNSRLITDLSFGVELVIFIKVYLIGGFTCMVIDMSLDLTTDDVDADEKLIIHKAMETSEAAGKVLISRSIKTLAHALVYSTALYIVMYNPISIGNGIPGM